MTNRLVPCQIFLVGRVERSDTRHVLIVSIMSGFASLYPTYKRGIDKVLICIISLLLLFSGCNVEEKPHVTVRGGDWYTVQVNISDNWKIANAQLEADRLHLEVDKGKRIEKLNLQLLFPLENFNKDVAYRGANRLDGIALLHFTKEDKQQAINNALGKTIISKGLKSCEVLAFFRVGNRLFINFRIENTPIGYLTAHDLEKHYLSGRHPDQRTNRPFKITKGNLEIEFSENHKENRTIPMKNLVKANEVFGGSFCGSILQSGKLEWECLIEFKSK